MLAVNIFIILSVFVSSIHSWDNEDLELFDLVEEINGNFYELLELKRDDNINEIKRAYRKIALKLHPDKNTAPDAEVQFRQLVAVYEILKDEEKRKKYDNVLDNGLPDWRQPVFYYRKARKLGLLELAGLLSLIITVGQYLVMWAAYLERRLAMEDFFMSKRKRETGRRGKAMAINDKLEEDMHQTLEALPKPRIKNLWPITFTKWATLRLVTLPVSIREWREGRRLAAEIKEQERQEEERKREEYLKESELRKQKRKVKHEPVIATAILSDVTPIMYGMSVEDDDSEGSVSEIGMKTGEWTDEDYVMLSKAYIKFPGGTVERWEKIADMVGRPVSEVTAKCKKMKGNFKMNLSTNVQAGLKTKKNIVQISDNIISKPEEDVIKEVPNDENTIRRRNKDSTNVERTLMISKSDSDEMQDADTQVKSAYMIGAESSSQNSTTGTSRSKSKSEKLLVSVNDKVGASVPAIKSASEKSLGSDDPEVWSQNQQVILEWALKQHPKGTEQRWEKIAEHIPGKSKEDCIQRFKYLAELVKQRKMQ